MVIVGISSRVAKVYHPCGVCTLELFKNKDVLRLDVAVDDA